MQDDEFSNSEAFAEVIAHMREAAAVTQQQIADAGGPSDTTQSWIERGQPQPVTDATINKYRIAFDTLRPHALNTSYLSALADAHHYHQGGDTAAEGVERMAKEWTDPDNIYVGVQLGDGHWPVTASTLTCYTSAPGAFHLRRSTPADERDFQRLAVHLASIHPSLALLPSSQAGTGELARVADGHWPKGVPIKTFGQVPSRFSRTAIDPIDGLSSLGAARDRAVALGARGDESVTLGWAILLANMLARYLDGSPIAAWIAHSDNHAIWEEVIGKLPNGLSKHAPDLYSMLRVANDYLRGWADEYTMAQWNIGLGDSGKDHINWDATPSHDVVDPTRVHKGELWIYNNQQFPKLPEVLFSLCANTVSLYADRIVTTTRFQPKQYGWLPTGIENSKTCLLRNEADGTWQAVRTP